MATPSLKWDASDVALKVTTASGGVVTMSFPDRASDVAFNMPLTALTNPMTTAGDVIVATTDGVPARVAIGTNGQVLQSNGTTAVWATLSYLTNPMTTDGDLIVGGASGVPARLAKGTDTQVLTMVSGGVAWADATGGTGGFENPMTAVGDLILGGTAGAATRLAIGTTGKVLTSNGTTATWEAPVTGFSNPMTTIGDIITADTGGTAKRLGVGSEGQILKVVSGEPAWDDASAGGAILQHIFVISSADITTTSKVTFYAPTISEGVEYGSITITPTRAGTKILVKTNAECSLSRGYSASHIALFKNSTSACLDYGLIEVQTADWTAQILCQYSEVTADTTAITFSARGGSATTGIYTIRKGALLEVIEIA